MMCEARHGVARPTRDDRHDRLWSHGPRGAVGGCHVLDAKARRVEMPRAVLVGHDRVVDQLRPLCHRHGTEPQQHANTN